jgi:hypothetical protein
MRVWLAYGWSPTATGLGKGYTAQGNANVHAVVHVAASLLSMWRYPY